MRLILRIAGTWLIAIATILIIVDGTRSLGAGELIMTSLADSWGAIHPLSLEAVEAFFSSRLFGAVLQPTVAAILDIPGFLVIGVPGLVLALMGRRRASRQFIRQDQF